MRIPRSLVINGDRWRVITKSLKQGDLGQCVRAKKEILLDPAQPTSEMEDTFLHEVLHACLFEPWDDEQEEQMVRRLAPRLLAVLKGLGWVK